MSPLAAGLGAAIAWGIADYAGGIASRRIPAVWTSIGMQGVGTVLYAAGLALLGRWPAVDATVAYWSLALGALGGVSLLLLYRGLALGPIAVVSPITAGYSAVTVVLVVLFLGERLSTAEAIAIAVTFLGVLLASADLRAIRRLAGRPLPGVGIAFLAMLGFGMWGGLMTAATREVEPLALILGGRVAGFGAMLAAALLLRSGVPADRRPRTLGLVLAAAVFDTLANVLFVLGVAAGEAAIVATASGLYPVLPAVLAIAVLKERLAPNQYAGVAILVAGLVALGYARG
ncbi:MAG TPA: DMT family transporter [Candidatus Limnocylindria bacterium]|nr:DMT family transporter [Candidatus Limnocylindria bacterium]